MKKKNSRKKAQKQQSRPTQAEVNEMNRRNFLKLARNGALSLVGLSGAGWWVASGVQALAKEQDLTYVGQGTPSVVQIHDPSCSMCTELQRQARKALRCFDDAKLLYKVANIKTPEGSAFSHRTGLPHVTLVLIDGQGEIQEVLQGVRRSSELKESFETHFPTAMRT